MTLDAGLVVAYFLVFAKATAMLLAAPALGGNTPVQVRAFFGAALAAALLPVLRPSLPAAPETVYELAAIAAREAAVGLALGLCLQMLIQAAQMAGAFLDLQIGLGAAQLLNPMTGQQVSILAQFKYILAVVILLISNGHHVLLDGFVRSYSVAPPTMASLPGAAGQAVAMVGALSLLALQIAAPVAAVCLVVDAAAGIVNKAVPTMQAYLVSLPAKILLGLLFLGLGLPALVVAVKQGTDLAVGFAARMVGG